MANLVDPDTAEPGDLDALQKNLTQAVPAPETTPTEEPASPDPLAGTKFEGKSLEDVLNSYKNLESAYGKMANDLGTQRKLTDRLLDLKREEDLTSNAPPVPSIDSADLLDNPNETLDSFLQARDARIRQETDERLQTLEAQLQADRFAQKHPDYMEVVEDTEFQTWAQASPLRARVGAAAAAGDYDAADALLTEFKQYRESAPAPAVDDSAGVEAAKALALESANSAPASNSGQVFRRSDIIRMKLEKPHVYNDPGFQAELLKAYSEGRVK